MAIIETNADPIHWGIYAALGGGELNEVSYIDIVHHCLMHFDI